MKRMTKEAQMQANGGGYAHCHKCNKNYFFLTNVLKNMNKHIKDKGHTGVAYWGYGKIEYCDYTYR